MNIFFKKIYMLFLMIFFLQVSYAQKDTVFKEIALVNLDAFSDPPPNWIIASDATADLEIPLDLKPIKGTGAVVNNFAKNNRMHLYTKDELGDTEIELDFMMSKNSNSGVYLQGRYEVQLLDSWSRGNPTSADVGGIYSRWNPERGTFEGTPPIENVARAPGLWQHLNLKFRAPKFDANGNKIKNARFEEVYLNDLLVQEATDVTGPTASAMFTDEKSLGPLVLQGDHGTVAFKNIRYRSLRPFADSVIPYSDAVYWETRDPVIVNPALKNQALRSFMNYGNITLTHIISIANTSEVNFAYNLSNGSIIKIWRGKFLDVTRMWVGRGEPQLARPLGSVITLQNAPFVAKLSGPDTSWPDSVAFDNFQPHGYSLDTKRAPTFSYSNSGLDVKDSITFEDSGKGITRYVSITNPDNNTYCRLAAGKNIVPVNDSLYTIDDRTFYISIDRRYQPVVRKSGNRQELIVKYNPANPIKYSIVW